MADYNILFQGANPATAFSDAFQHAQEKARVDGARNALAQLVQNPDDPKSLAALARVDPATALDFRKQQVTEHQNLLKQHQDSILKGAEILRQFNPKDQATYTQALQAAQAAGIDVSQVPQDYRPDYVQGIIHAADALKPEAGSQDPGIIREFDIATQRGLIPPGTSYQQYVQLRSPSVNQPITIPYNSTVQSGGGATGEVTATGPGGQKLRLNPQTNQWEPMGGAGGDASGGFRTGPQ